jgi:outer membrane receptor for ferric coprogen and ferric-rhodotorulic acid
MSPTWILNQSVEKSWEQLSLRADLRYQSSSFIDFGNANKIEGFTTVDLAAIYRWPTVELGVHLNNLFSERYFSNGYLDVNGEGRYFAQAPANLFVSLTWKL